MRIDYLTCKWANKEHTAVLLEGLKLDGEDIGNFLADTSSDIGSEILQYLKDTKTDEPITESVNRNIMPTVNISMQTAIQNITKWFYSYVDTIAQNRGYASATDCLFNLFAADEDIKHEARVFLTWKTKVFEIFRSYIKDFNDAQISILDFTTENLLAKLPALNWDADNILDELGSIFGTQEVIQETNFTSVKTKTSEAVTKQYLKLKGIHCTDMYFKSSIRDIYVNGDLTAKVNIEALLSTLKKDTDKVIFKSYSNFFVELTKKELTIIYKELLQNQLNVTKIYWNIQNQIAEATNLALLNRIDTNITISNFGTVDEA